MDAHVAALKDAHVEAMIEAALAEDGWDDDVTSRLTVPEAATGAAILVAKAPGVVAGLGIAARVFGRVDPELCVGMGTAEGDFVKDGDSLMTVEGRLRAILVAERTALNFLAHLSGVATLANLFVEAVQGTDCRITDTRKTTPGWRRLEKWAAALGGAVNHRSGLSDMVLIKENHIRAAAGLAAAVEASLGEAEAAGLEIEVEVTSLDALEIALQTGARRILLDNMSLESLREAVRRVSSGPWPSTILEASGGVRLDTVRAIAETGIDLISVGMITHSAQALDLSLQVVSG